MSSSETASPLPKNLDLLADFPAPTYDDWLKVVEKDLKGGSFEKKLLTKTLEGITLHPLYTRQDTEPLAPSPWPAMGNLTRGTHAAGYLGHPWEICQDIPYTSAQQWNQDLQDALQNGQTAIAINTADVPINTVSDMAALLNQIDLHQFPLYIQAEQDTPSLYCLLQAYARQQGLDLAQLRGSIACDPLSSALLTGQTTAPPAALFEQLAEAIHWSHSVTPQIRMIGIHGSHWHNAGAHAAQELAYAMATAVEYVNQLTERGLTLAQIAPSLRFTFGIGANLFMEIAKFRAVRLLWSRIMAAWGEPTAAQQLWVHAETSTYFQTRYDPYVNVLRTTTQAFSALVGGVDSLNTQPFDAAYQRPDTFSRRLARNVQLILREESYLHRLIDPAGGSFYVETLTQELAQKAWELFQDIEIRGGMLAALQTGFPQSQVEATAQERTQAVRTRKAGIVGVNQYANLTEPWPQLKLTETQEQHLPADPPLDAILGNDRLETSIRSASQGATAAQLAQALGYSRGNGLALKPLHLHRLAEEFEQLRDQMEKHLQQTGQRAQVYLIPLGALEQYKARSDFARGFLEVGGFEVLCPTGFQTAEAVFQAVLAADCPRVVLCSSDEAYQSWVPALVPQLKQNQPNLMVVLAGYPKDQVESYRQAGVDAFIYLSCDAYTTLSQLQGAVHQPTN